MQLEFGIATPSTLWDLNLSARQAMVADIYQQGFSHIYMADHVAFRDGSGNDGLISCAALAQLHADIKVMTGIYLLPLRHPVAVARQLLTLAEQAPGRVLFGIGIGGEDPHEYAACGMDPRQRGRAANEALEIITGLLAGDEVALQGAVFDVPATRVKPLPTEPVPIIVGGRSDAALNRTAAWADGWVGVWCSPGRYAQALDHIHTEAELKGRGQTTWYHGYQPWVGVADNEADARQVVKSMMEGFYKIPFEKFERYVPYGTPEQVAEQLMPYAEAGSTFFNLKICTPNMAEEVSAGGEVVRAMQAG